MKHCTSSRNCAGPGFCTCECQLCRVANGDELGELRAKLRAVRFRRLEIEADLRKTKGEEKDMVRLLSDMGKEEEPDATQCAACGGQNNLQKVGNTVFCLACRGTTP